MGDLTLGAHTIAGLAYDETTGAYVRDYGNDGLLNEILVAPMEHIWEMTLIVIIFVALGAYTLWAGLKKDELAQTTPLVVTDRLFLPSDDVPLGHRPQPSPGG